MAGACKAHALIGADGLWSRVREAIVGDGKPRVSGHIAYRAVLPMDQVPGDLCSPDVTLWGGEKTHLVHYPLRRGELFNLVAVFHSDRYEEGWNTFGDPEELNLRFQHAAPPVLRAAGQDRDLEDVGAVRPRAGGQLVEGPRHAARRRRAPDAAVPGPRRQHGDRGRGRARRARCSTPDDVPAAFRAYQQARYLRTGRVQLTARFYGDIYHASGVMRELRNRMFQSGDEVGRLHRHAMAVSRHRPRAAAGPLGGRMSARPDPKTQIAAERQAYYQAIRSLHLTPAVGAAACAGAAAAATRRAWPRTGATTSLRPHLMRVGRAHQRRRGGAPRAGAREPGRCRRLASITQSLYAGLQLILPGEVAPAHRHTQSALRFVVEGQGAYTAVDGERTTMQPGDFIITPAWTWHDHGSDAGGTGGVARRARHPAGALLRRRLRRERRPTESQADHAARRPQPGALRRQHGAAARSRAARRRLADLQLPVRAQPRGAARSCNATARSMRGTASSCAYINPATGGAPMPTMAAFLQLLPAGFDGKPYRQTDGAVFSVVEGRGVAVVGDGAAQQRFEFAPRDHFVVPSWQRAAAAGARRVRAVQLLRPAGAAGHCVVARAAPRRLSIQLPPASSDALPPAAAVLIVSVCSAQKRYR